MRFRELVWVSGLVMLSLSFLHVDGNATQSLKLVRQKRSIEGQPCKFQNSTCKLPHTICNEKTQRCECDRSVSVGMRMTLYPEVVECIPLDYPVVTGSCLPTNPDMCSIIAPGSKCDVSQRRATSGTNTMACICSFSGTYPTCSVRIGSLCSRNDTCQRSVANSFCGDVKDGFGVCICGGLEHENKTFVANTDGTLCLPTNCAANPCRGDPDSSRCEDKAEGFECICKDNTKGRGHTFIQNGICCETTKLPCDDFFKCIPIADMCNGIADCEDCSDETKHFCAGDLTSNNTRCGAPRIRGLVTTTLATTPVSTTAEPVPLMNAVNPELGSQYGNGGLFSAGFNPFAPSFQGGLGQINPGWAGPAMG